MARRATKTLEMKSLTFESHVLARRDYALVTRGASLREFVSVTGTAIDRGSTVLGPLM